MKGNLKLLFYVLLALLVTASPGMAFFKMGTWVRCLPDFLLQVRLSSPVKYSLRRDPVGFYLAASRLPASQINSLEFDAFRDAAKNLIEFAEGRAKTNPSSLQAERLLYDAAHLRECFKKGFLSYTQLLGSLREISFSVTQGEIDWGQHHTTWQTIQQILEFGGILIPVVQDDLLSRRALQQYRGTFLYQIQTPLTDKQADGSLMNPGSFLHHDLRHTVRMVLADVGFSSVQDALGGYLPPLARLSNMDQAARQKFLRESYRRHAALLSAIDSIPSSDFQERVDYTLHQLFHEGIDVPGYISMPWEPDLIRRTLLDSGHREYFYQHLIPRLQPRWGRDKVRQQLDETLSWLGSAV